MDTAFVGRQPIFWSNLKVYGYELLFRSGDESSAIFDDGDRATATVLVNSFVDVGIGSIVGAKRAFINVTRNLLLSQQLTFLPPDRVVLEILEDIEPDDEVLACVQDLVDEGYSIALDDFVFRPELAPLVELADIVKVEFPQISKDELPDHIAKLRDLGVKLILAEKIETHAGFELCRDLGCDLYQGYFFCRPQVLSQRKPKSGNLAAVVRLLGDLQKPDITAAQAADVIRTDVNLSYNLLRFANSAVYATTKKIESLQHATAMMGVQRLRSLASMMLLAGMDKDKPQELIKIALTRAKMCESLAEVMGDACPQRLYTLGLLSVMDAILDIPMEEVVSLLPLDADMNEALLHHTGEYGELLACVISFGTENTAAPSSLKLSSGQVLDSYLDALRWTMECNVAE